MCFSGSLPRHDSTLDPVVHSREKVAVMRLRRDEHLAYGAEGSRSNTSPRQAILLLLRAFRDLNGAVLGSVALRDRGRRTGIWLEEGFSTSCASRAGRAKSYRRDPTARR